jgi:hypothetical protein
MLTTALIKEFDSKLCDVENCTVRELGMFWWRPKGSLKSPTAWQQMKMKPGRLTQAASNKLSD